MNEIEVYHGGTDIVQFPKVDRGRPYLDFGPGFYMTDIYVQAENWAMKMADQRNANPVLNIYILEKKNLIEHYRCKIFSEYNQEWLEFISACRLGLQPWKEFDYIEGGVADDRVVDTVRLFMGGFLSLDDAIKRLKYFRPASQICILNQDVLDKHLIYKNYIEL